MGRYAEALLARLHPQAEPPPLPRDGGWVLLSHDALPVRVAEQLAPGVPRRLVLGHGVVRAATRGVVWARIEAGSPPRLSSEARAELAAGYVAAVLVDGMREVSGRLLLELAACGVRLVAWRAEHGWVVRGTRRLACGKPLYRAWVSVLASNPGAWARRRLQRARAHAALAQRNLQAFPGEDEWRRHLERHPAVPVPAAGQGRLRIVHYIGRLNSGGAERQLVNLARAQRRAGHDVRVLTTYPLTDADAHYLPLLREAGVPAAAAGAVSRPAGLAALAGLELHPELLGALPEPLRHPVADLAGELLAAPPHLLHCWLDQPNITGGMAALLAGTPQVLLSTRNLNPTHFPQFYQPWMDVWYRYLAAQSRVALLANSTAGAQDYARWLDLPRETFHVLRNGVDFASLRRPGAAEVSAWRAEFGIAPGAPLVAGVFRLAQEKQPLLFLDVLARARQRVPGLRVVLAGIGPLQSAVAQRITRLGLDDVVTLAGQRRDVATLLAAADVTLLTSSVEGTPNVLLEAQWLGCPPVATAVGGTPDAVLSGRTGLLCAPQDEAGLAEALCTLLADARLRAEYAQAGRAFVEQRFGLARALQDTQDLYASRLGLPAAMLRGAVVSRRREQTLEAAG